MTAIPSAPIAPVDAALAETLPLTRSERRWTFFDVVSVKSGLAVATWAFLFGGATAQYVGFRDGMLTMLAGNIIGVVILLLSLVLPSSKWGTEFFVHQRSVYGPLGALVFVLVVVAAIIFAWAAILATMIGKSAVAMLQAVGAVLPLSGPALETAVAIGMLALSWVILVRGSEGVRILNRIAAPGLLLLCVWLMAALFSRTSLGELAAIAPIAPRADRATNIMLAVELNIAGGIGWASLAANLGRYAVTQRAVVWGSMVAYVPVYVLACAVGMVSALVLGSADPVTWMVPMVGPAAGVLLLLLLAAANLSSLVSMVQGNCQTLIQHGGARLQRLGWPRFTMAFFACVAAVVLLASNTLYDRFYTVIAFAEAILAPMCGIALADRAVLRQNRVDVRALYDTAPTGAYAYWGGINYAAFVALIAGAVVYLVLLDPVTMTGTPAFVRLSASVPAVATGFVVQLVLTQLVVMRARKGAYPTAASPR